MNIFGRDVHSNLLNVKGNNYWGPGDVELGTNTGSTTDVYIKAGGHKRLKIPSTVTEAVEVLEPLELKKSAVTTLEWDAVRVAPDIIISGNSNEIMTAPSNNINARSAFLDNNFTYGETGVYYFDLPEISNNASNYVGIWEDQVTVYTTKIKIDWDGGPDYYGWGVDNRRAGQTVSQWDNTGALTSLGTYAVDYRQLIIEVTPTTFVFYTGSWDHLHTIDVAALHTSPAGKQFRIGYHDTTSADSFGTVILKQGPTLQIPDVESSSFNLENVVTKKRYLTVDTVNDIVHLPSTVFIDEQPYGELYSDVTDTTPLTTKEVWYNLENSVNGVFNNFEKLVPASLRYTGTYQRMYHCGYSISFTTSANNQEIEVGIYKYNSDDAAGTIIPGSIIRRKIGATNDYGSSAGHAMCTLANNDYLQLHVRNMTDSSKNITCTYYNLFTVGLGPQQTAIYN